jgi:hypothetical protein
MADDSVTGDWHHLMYVTALELRNHLSVALGYAGMLQSERVGPLAEKQQHCVNELRTALGNIAQVVNTVSAFSRPESSVQPLRAISGQSLLSGVLGELPPFIVQNFGPFDLRVVAASDQVMGSPLLAEGFRSAVKGVFRGIVTSLQPKSVWIVDPPDLSERWIVMAAADQIQEAAACPRERLLPLTQRQTAFLDLPFASRVVRAHSGQLLALPEGLSGAIIVLRRPSNDETPDSQDGPSENERKSDQR